MNNEAYKTYLSIRNGFDRMSELGKFLSFLQTQIDIHGGDITAKELKKKLVDEFCGIENRLLTCCKDIKL